mmetsp:Transcript_4482/g.10530  ORF Transcript_4482/g.10530 Transcript_4482/m.10530 type:complete len:209 (-) Transcript_4482:1310-1936(-)
MVVPGRSHWGRHGRWHRDWWQVPDGRQHRRAHGRRAVPRGWQVAVTESWLGLNADCPGLPFIVEEELEGHFHPIQVLPRILQVFWEAAWQEEHIRLSTHFDEAVSLAAVKLSDPPNKYPRAISVAISAAISVGSSISSSTPWWWQQEQALCPVFAIWHRPDLELHTLLNNLLARLGASDLWRQLGPQVEDIFTQIVRLDEAKPLGWVK